MIQYAMVIDLQKCVGCGACALACKTENNTQNRGKGQTFNWADFEHENKGTFPNLDHVTMPVLCNHCAEPPCVEACPTEPKAMFKTDEGITMYNEERCIGCRYCQEECPYSKPFVDAHETSVISRTDDGGTYPAYRDNTELIKGCTSSGAETAEAAKATPPYKNKYDHPDYPDARINSVIEKCTFCDHRLKKGQQPYCVDSCPADARIFGDVNDSNSMVAKLLKQHKSFVRKPEEGTEPNVHYIRKFKK
jgi:Fe-S-cluster-containing dehydrogenase component